jgi:hypothetical protein
MEEMLSIKNENGRFTTVGLRTYHVMYSTCILLRILHFLHSVSNISFRIL